MRRRTGRASRALGRAGLCLTLLAALGTWMPLETDDHAARGAADRARADAEVLTLDILTWNVQLRPFLPEGKRWRTPRIADRLGGYDAVLLQEAYSNPHRKLLSQRLAKEYPHRTRVLGRSGWFTEDGGVVILSKWPIEAQQELLFGALCEGSDCLADKGALYARINKQGRRVHLIATHLQSGPARAVREQQMARMREWLDRLRLPQGEPVLIGGDLNTDRLADGGTGAFTRMLEILRAAHPAAPDGVHQPTYDPLRNARARGTTGRYVDFLLHARDHLPPRHALNRVLRLAADGRPLSDHFPVHGRFVFGTAPLAAAPASS